MHEACRGCIHAALAGVGFSIWSPTFDCRCLVVPVAPSMGASQAGYGDPEAPVEENMAFLCAHLWASAAFFLQKAIKIQVFLCMRPVGGAHHAVSFC